MPEITTVKVDVNLIQRQAGSPQTINQVTKQYKNYSSRHYEIDGLELPSVTTVLGKAWPKPALNMWYAKRGRESMKEYLSQYIGKPVSHGLLDSAVDEARIAPNRERDEAATIGSRAHNLVHEELMGEGIVVPPDLKIVMDAWTRWKKSQNLLPIESEVAVFNGQYAGTIDGLFRSPDGRYVLLEIKTSKGLYQDHFVQACAYAKILKDNMLMGEDIDVQIIRLGKDTAEFESVILTDAEIESCNRQWDAAYDLYSALKLKGVKR